VTVEANPEDVAADAVHAWRDAGVNRVSLGSQSFDDGVLAWMHRTHDAGAIGRAVDAARAAGIDNISLDLIAGLPHQTRESWEYSLSETIATGVPHASVYMLEVDEDSRLGSELMAGGTKYHAHFVPDDDTTAELYERACERLNETGIGQYEISNFARAGFESRHNRKYWTRQPYVGFGVDAHSMLPSADPALDAVRFATSDALEDYVAGKRPTVTVVDRAAAAEEEWFLGLRLNRGVDPKRTSRDFSTAIGELVRDGLLEGAEGRVRLTTRGRLLSNEVFERFISPAGPHEAHEGATSTRRSEE